jgi:alpha-beta hydrolase superfamily lysophospholipase
MSAEPYVASDYAPDSSLADALYFDSGEHRLFGWLHRPKAGAAADLGLVICKPFGYEAVCSHRSLRAFAEAAVELGVPTLRFDYLGTGDSAELDSRADQLTAWTRDVVAAVSELQKRTGVKRVCLLGFRLGALLATLAAGECRAVCSLILVSPTIKGRRYLRELRTTRLAASIGSDAGPAAATTDAMEVSGFPLSAATIASLEQVDLTTRGAPPVADALVIDGSSLPGSRAWAEQLTGLGVPTQYLSLPGLIEMIMTAPQFAMIPQEMVEAVRARLRQLLPAGPGTCTSDAGRYADTLPVPAITTMTLRDDASAHHAVVTERPVFFTSDTVLFGILTEPHTEEKRRRAVILLNAGADNHTGANGMYVELARQWARRGYVVLRMDLAGIGDSATRPGRPDNEVFPPGALDDIRTAAEFLRGRYRARDITIFGLCSGAYHALRAAVAGIPVNRILMVNPQNYFWKEGATLDTLQVAEVVRNPGVYRQKIFSGAAWRRLLTGKVNVLRIARIYLQRPLLDLESLFRNLVRRMHLHLPYDLGWELREIAARGVRIVFVFARGEAGIDLLKIEAGYVVKQLGERCRVHVVDGADHVFSQSKPRGVLTKILSDELFSRM